MHCRIDRTRITNAAHATEATGVEAQVLQAFDEAGGCQDIFCCTATRSEDALDPWLRFQALRGGVAREQTSCDHHRRVGCGCATRYCRDRERSVSKIVRLASDLDLDRI